LFCIFLSTNVFDNGSNKEFGVKMFLIEVSRGGPNLFFIPGLFNLLQVEPMPAECYSGALTRPGHGPGQVRSGRVKENWNFFSSA